jgi:hypothetical protein
MFECRNLKNKGGSTVLHFYNGSYIRAVTKLYPELKLKHSSFVQSKGLIIIRACSPKVTFSLERKRAERRKFFDEFAKSKGFHPLDVDQWYLISWKELISAVSKSNPDISIF